MMAATTSWDYEIPHIVTDGSQRASTKRIRVVTCISRGLFADAMSNVMEQENFEVVRTHDRDAIVELAGDADGCVIDLAFEDFHELLTEISRANAHLRVVVLAGAKTSTATRAIALRFPNAHVTCGESLDRVLAALRGDEGHVDRRTRPARRHDSAEERDPRRLTRREAEILEGLLEGENTKILATRLGVSPATARTHVQSVLSKLGVHSRLEAVALVNSGSLDVSRDRRNGSV